MAFMCSSVYMSTLTSQSLALPPHTLVAMNLSPTSVLCFVSKVVCTVFPVRLSCCDEECVFLQLFPLLPDPGQPVVAVATVGAVGGGKVTTSGNRGCHGRRAP